MTYWSRLPASRRSLLLAFAAGLAPGALLAAEKTTAPPRTSALPIRNHTEAEATFLSMPEFPTLAAAQAAAASGALAIGQTLRILGYAEPGDGGGFSARVVAPGERGAHPQASRLKIIGAL